MFNTIINVTILYYFDFQARVIKGYEEKLLFCPCFYNRYYNHITKKCNPLIKKYAITDEQILLKVVYS